MSVGLRNLYEMKEMDAIIAWIHELIAGVTVIKKDLSTRKAGRDCYTDVINMHILLAGGAAGGATAAGAGAAAGAGVSSVVAAQLAADAGASDSESSSDDEVLLDISCSYACRSYH